MKKRKRLVSTSVILFSGVIPLICTSVCAQGISEYGGVHSIPKNLPSKHASGHNNKLYNSASRHISKASKGSAKAGSRSRKTDNVTRMLQRQQAKQDVIKLGRKASTDLQKARKLMSEKKYDEAIKSYQSTLAIRLQYWRGRDKDIPEIYKELAEIYAIQGKFKKAEKSLQGSISSYSRLHGPGSKYAIVSLEKLGDVYDKQGEQWKSHDSYKQALTLTSRYKGADSKESMDLRLQLIDKVHQLDEPRMERDYYQKVLEVNETSKILTKEQHLDVLTKYRDILKKLNSNSKVKDVQKQIEALKASR